MDGGGGGNRVGSNDGDTTNATYATVSGGVYNTATGLDATAGGDYSNDAGGDRSVVGGGYNNTAGAQANATHQDSFVWSGAESTAAAARAGDPHRWKPRSKGRRPMPVKSYIRGD